MRPEGVVTRLAICEFANVVASLSRRVHVVPPSDEFQIAASWLAPFWISPAATSLPFQATMSSMLLASGKAEGADQLRPVQVPLEWDVADEVVGPAVSVVDVTVGRGTTLGEADDDIGRSDRLAVAVVQANALAPTRRITARPPMRRRRSVSTCRSCIRSPSDD
jgi:hypothetical protein